MQLFILIVLCLYVFMIIKYTVGWIKISKLSNNNFFPRVSVIIIVRNEEAQITALLENLQSQIYPFNKLEFIFVDDHSTDNTFALLEKSNLDNLQVLSMPKNKFGKKDGICIAVSAAKGDIIISSDADCSFSVNWVKKMVSHFINDKIKLVSGPVLFKKKKGILQSLQALEFLSLIGSGAGAIGIDNAIFCNGANMAYRKDVFLDANNFKNDKAISGDHLFLLHSIKAKYPTSIAFAKDVDAIVQTTSPQTLDSFINQRKRWTAKSIKYKDFSTIYISFLILITNLCFVSLFVALFFNIYFLHYFLFFYAIKFIADVCFLSPILIFFNRKDLIKWIFPFELFYSFYIVLIVFFSFTTKFEWKDRVHTK